MSKSDQNQISLSLPGGDLTGTPSSVGAEVFKTLVFPALNALHGVDKTNIARFYGGLTAALVGAVVADFGNQFAVDMLTDMAEQAANLCESEGKLH